MVATNSCPSRLVGSSVFGPKRIDFPSRLVAALLLKQSDHVCGERAEHDDGGKAVDISRGLESAQQAREPRRPGSIGEFQGKSGDRQGEEADDHAGV